MPQPHRISAGQVERQLNICAQIAERNARLPEQPKALVDTYGCQQNEADSERIRGYLRAMGYAFTEDFEEADVIVINTCAVREHAETRVFGNVGALVHVKRRHPGQILCLCGCAMQEPHVSERIRRSYRHVDLVFGPHALWKFPSLLWEVMNSGERLFAVEPDEGSIAEGIPVLRRSRAKAWVSVMYGCNNFCSYCIVPYVRGRERSRQKGDILRDVRSVAEAGCGDITLLGQNVNSYGRDLGGEQDFSDLLREVCDVPGRFRVRFMTSHPKDASEKLFRTMAECSKIAPALHLPFQAGSDRVLAAMNRGYTAAQYLQKVERLRSLIPDICLTSDVIVGFPGETEEEFEDTLRIIREVRFDALFTFLYSPRRGTPAASLDDPVSAEEKRARFQRLLDLQNGISAEKHRAYVGTVQEVLIDGLNADLKSEYNLTSRTAGGRLVHLRGDPDWVGSWATVKIEQASTWALFGTVTERENTP